MYIFIQADEFSIPKFLDTFLNVTGVCNYKNFLIVFKMFKKKEEK